MKRVLFHCKIGWELEEIAQEHATVSSSLEILKTQLKILLSKMPQLTLFSARGYWTTKSPQNLLSFYNSVMLCIFALFLHKEKLCGYHWGQMKNFLLKDLGSDFPKHELFPLFTIYLSDAQLNTLRKYTQL